MTGGRPQHRTPPDPARLAARWRREAACRGMPIEVFYPGRGESAGPARQACGQCPARQQCLEYAVSSRIVYGIWGGLTGPERRTLQSDWLRAARRDRDEAIRAADANGLAAEAIARSFGISRMTVTRIARGGDRGGRAEPEPRAPFVPPPREGGR